MFNGQNAIEECENAAVIAREEGRSDIADEFDGAATDIRKIQEEFSNLNK